MGTYYYYVTLEGDWLVVTTRHIEHMPNGVDLIPYDEDFFELLCNANKVDLRALEAQLSMMHYMIQVWMGD